ncbi:MAG: L-serine ammonia-lyase [Desulfobacteraceae bacterium]|nr:L-serine ammonia-lyase [Desulfobacteraceae bacterium]
MSDVFSIYKIGIGPSSSHTVGPMRAAREFAAELMKRPNPDRVAAIHVELFGSLALTGKGHGTDKAILLGLSGERPDTVLPEKVEQLIADIRDRGAIRLMGIHPVTFAEKSDLTYHFEKRLPFHSNAVRFRAVSTSAETVYENVYYSVGGGTILSEAEAKMGKTEAAPVPLPHDFSSAADLLKIGEDHGLGFDRILLENEIVLRPEPEIYDYLRNIRATMSACIDRGLCTEGVLPGGLNLKRRAPQLHKELTARRNEHDPLLAMDLVSLWAIAVNEENAAGGRVVTAPTNGAAGIIPAVLRYYETYHSPVGDDGIFTFLLCAAAIGALYKKNASISGAEVGCQGEVGVAASMAAAGLTAALGGTNAQVENAAEIGMEHNLGLTCDPVAGLVQVPCIERNAMGAIKAINAARLALRGDGTHFISLDKVIQTMRQTGADMQDKYKETARGGLAVNIIEC